MREDSAHLLRTPCELFTNYLAMSHWIKRMLFRDVFVVVFFFLPSFLPSSLSHSTSLSLYIVLSLFLSLSLEEASWALAIRQWEAGGEQKDAMRLVFVSHTQM